jgi:hypothetical protein
MKAISKILTFSILVFALTSCSAFAPQPTQTPVPTATSLPTLTATPEPTSTSTPTEEPTNTPVPPTATKIPPTPTSAGSDLPLPTGKPVSNWEGIPVMPKAIAGDGDHQGYSYTIIGAPEVVQAYYEREMPKLGWGIFASGTGETKAILIFFKKGSDLATVSIIPQGDNLLYVLLVKS